jgi:CheY-like chemotaxis protein
MAANIVNVAFLGFIGTLGKRLALVLAEPSNSGLSFTYVANPLITPCDLALVDADDAEAILLLNTLRKAWPALIALWVSDSGTVGDSDYRLDRANLFTRFRPTLDQAAANAAIVGGQRTDRKTVPEAKPILQGALCALVVDDSLTVRQQLSGALNRLGLNTEEAADGDMALTKAKLKAYELFIVDVTMPGLDGYALTKRIHELPNHQLSPVIILTNRKSPIDRVRGALSGCCAYLAKPINMKDLLVAVDAALTKRFNGDRQALSKRGYRLDHAPPEQKPQRTRTI